MKRKLLIAAATTLVSGTAIAQSAFAGFYGQIATGYESNSLGSGSGSISSPLSGEYYSTGSSSQQFGAAPLVIGLGYNFQVSPKWLLGIGADYSALSQTSSTFATNLNAPGIAIANFSGNSIQLSNRFNIFITPGYEIDKDKLIYLKAGYSSTSAKLNGSNIYNVAVEGQSIQAPVSMGSSTSTVGGYVVGLGYRQVITGGIYGFAEFNYMSYAKPSFSSSGAISYPEYSVPINSTLSASLNSYQALIGVGYRF